MCVQLLFITTVLQVGYIKVGLELMLTIVLVKLGNCNLNEQKQICYSIGYVRYQIYL